MSTEWEKGGYAFLVVQLFSMTLKANTGEFIETTILFC